MIAQETLARQATARDEQRIREAEIHRGRIHAAHDQLTRSYTMLALSASYGQFTADTVGQVGQAIAQLRVECPELSAPLDQISQSLLSPQNISNVRARELLDQVNAGVERALWT